RRGDGEEPDLARPGEAANEAERRHGEEGQRAGVDERHILREIEPRRSQAASQIELSGAQYSMCGSIAPKRSAKANCSRCTGWIEPAAAEAKLISGRFERAANSMVMMIGTAAMSEPLTATAASGLMLARRRAHGSLPATQYASTKPART